MQLRQFCLIGVILLIWVVTWSGGNLSAAAFPASTPTFRVLMVTATAGFHHASVVNARKVIPALGVSSGDFTTTIVAEVEDVSQFAPETLAPHDVVMFANTTGELPLTDAQKNALIQFVQAGGGFVGTHSATDTLYTWPEYGDLIGARFLTHNDPQVSSVNIEDTNHPATVGLGSRFDLFEEFYAFRENPRPRVHVLLSLDTPSAGIDGDAPLAWCSTFGQGRVYYNALGHFGETWEDVRYQQQLLGGIRWAAGLTPIADCDRIGLAPPSE